MSPSASPTEAIAGAALVAAVSPASVLDLGSRTPWTTAFRDLSVTDVVRVQAPGLPGGPGPLDGATEHDLRLPFVTERAFDLAVCIGTGADLPTSAASTLVASLCGAAPVVAFAAEAPGVAPPGTANPRWPAWWDSLFALHGLVPHDLLRPRLWLDDRVDVLVRQALVLYAAPGRFDRVELPSDAARSIVHPEAHHQALARAEARRHAEVAVLSGRLHELHAGATDLSARVVGLEAELAEATSHAGDGAANAPEEVLARLAELQSERDDRVDDVVLLWAALAARERTLTSRSELLRTFTDARQDLVGFAARAFTRALPIRRRLSTVLGAPAPLFDELYYVRRYPDVPASRLSPLWHYRRHGARTHRSPHPLFDPEWYIAQNPDVDASGDDPVGHYLRRGWREGRDPHPLFAGSWYQDHHDLGRWPRSPLEHYLEIGRPAGASPHPLFDPGWYVTENPDVAAAGVDPFVHFDERGWWEGRDPNPLFDTRWYLARNLDVAYQGTNPLEHYLRTGWHECRDPHPLFDVTWYQRAHAGSLDDRSEPLTHFLTEGAARHLSPGPLFDAAWYVAQHPDAEGANPVLHYLQFGAARGDAPSPWLDAEDEAPSRDRNSHGR